MRTVIRTSSYRAGVSGRHRNRLLPVSNNQTSLYSDRLLNDNRFQVFDILSESGAFVQPSLNTRIQDGNVFNEPFFRERRRREAREAPPLWTYRNQGPQLFFHGSYPPRGGTCSLMPKTFIKEITEMAHRHNVNVGTGDWAELLLQKGPSAFKQYVQECKDLGFDVIDLNADSLKIPEESLLRLIRIIKNERLKAKPLFGINFEKSAIPSKENRAFGAYIAPTPRGSEMIEDVELLIRKAERCLEAGADMIMIDADGICGHADILRTDAIAKIIGRLGLEKTMFEAASPETFEWFVRRYGSRVNLFVDHSHVGKLECFRSGALGMNPSSISRSRRLGPAIFF